MEIEKYLNTTEDENLDSQKIINMFSEKLIKLPPALGITYIE